jgi:hypothetical protein
VTRHRLAPSLTPTTRGPVPCPHLEEKPMQQKELCATCGEPTLDGNTTNTVRRHLDGTSLCPPRETVRAVRPAAEAGSAEATFTDAATRMLAGTSPVTAARIAAAAHVAADIMQWLPAATAEALSTGMPTPDLAELLSDLFDAHHGHTQVLTNLIHHLDCQDATDTATAWTRRTGVTLTRAVGFAAVATQGGAEAWQATHIAAGNHGGCGCPNRCVICAEATRDHHDLYCPFTEGSRPHETPVIAAAPTVLHDHTHRPGCPQAVRRPGHLFAMIAEAHVMCLMCGRLDTIDADTFDSYGGTTEGYERCTACGES